MENEHLEGGPDTEPNFFDRPSIMETHETAQKEHFEKLSGQQWLPTALHHISSKCLRHHWHSCHFPVMLLTDVILHYFVWENVKYLADFIHSFLSSILFILPFFREFFNIDSVALVWGEGTQDRQPRGDRCTREGAFISENMPPLVVSSLALLKRLYEPHFLWSPIISGYDTLSQSMTFTGDRDEYRQKTATPLLACALWFQVFTLAWSFALKKLDKNRIQGDSPFISVLCPYFNH